MSSKEVPELPLADPLDGTEEFHIVQGGNSRRTLISTVLALLVDAAPGLLDTLNELAAALGDDPNYAATMAAAIAAIEADIVALEASVAGKQASSATLTLLAALNVAGNAGKLVRVNAAANAFELGTALNILSTDADDYTLLVADEDKYIRLTAAGTKNVNIAAEATTALPANGQWHIRNVGAGDATIVPAGGVTVHLPASGSLVIPQGGTVTLKRVAADEFDLFGLVDPA